MTDDSGNRTTPAGSPFASRYGLVRPIQGRYLAGVCGALGRATNTDPVLWRVMLAVLVCFGGVGLLLYLLLWLVMPEEGDTASPVEAMFGQGRSGTSPVLVVLLVIIAAAAFIFIAPRPLYVLLLASLVVLAVVLLAQNRTNTATSSRERPDGTAPPGTGPAVAPPTVVGDGPGTAGAAGSEPGAAGAVTPGGGAGPAPADEQPPAPALTPPAAPPPTGTASTGYREPFAPHGPFAGSPPAPPPPGSTPPGHPPPGATPAERSALSTVTFFATLIGLGLLGALDLSGVLNVPLAAYAALGLVIAGGGLVVGAWFGRGRSLIALGLIFALALPVAHGVDTWDRPQHVGTEVTWTPADVGEMEDSYEISFGTGLLDLREVSFAGRDATTTLRASAGEIRVLVPPDVQVEVDARFRLAGGDIFGEQVGGMRTHRTFTDEGEAGGGTLRIEAVASLAGLEVRR